MFWLLPIIWIVYHFASLFIQFPYFITAYLDDFLFIPLLMGSSLLIQRHFIVRNTNFTFKWYYTCWVWLYTFLVFELLFPQINKAFTRDVFDGIAYAVGAIYFQLFVNKSDMVSQ